MEISFIDTQILVHLHVNKTNFRMKGFSLGLALKQRRKATRKSPISSGCQQPRPQGPPRCPTELLTSFRELLTRRALGTRLGCQSNLVPRALRVRPWGRGCCWSSSHAQRKPSHLTEHGNWYSPWKLLANVFSSSFL